jgi:hypothetical protein
VVKEAINNQNWATEKLSDIAKPIAIKVCFQIFLNMLKPTIFLW